MMVMARDVSVIEYASEPDNVQADRLLARQVNASIKEDTEAGKLFHKEARHGAPLPPLPFARAPPLATPLPFPLPFAAPRYVIAVQFISLTAFLAAP